MPKPILLVSDIDGTLLNSNHQLSEKNKQAIHHFMNQGHYFAVSTGRTKLSASPILEALKPNAPCIFMNGALLQKIDGTILQKTTLNKQYLMTFLEQLPVYCPTAVIEIFTANDIFIISDPNNKDLFIEEHQIPVIHTSLESILNEDWLKILICDPQIKQVEKITRQFNLHQQFNTFFSSDTFFEIVPLGISKGATLRHCASLLDCFSIAIGDYDNDIEMIQEADFGVAVANAPDYVKGVADYISTDNDHDALAHLIHVLLEEKICQTL